MCWMCWTPQKDSNAINDLSTKASNSPLSPIEQLNPPKNKLKKHQFASFIAVILFLIVFSLTLYVYLEFPLWETLKESHAQLKNFHLQHPVMTPLIFMSFYIIYASFSLPGIFILSLLSGYLFSQPLSTLYVICSATIGSSVLFLSTRFAFHGQVENKSGPIINRFKKGLQENAATTLLFLRLIPLFPFSVLNVASAFFGVPFWIFVWTTFVGMIPSVIIYTQAGKGFELLLQSSDPLNPLNFFNLQMILSMFGLAFLSILPFFYSYIKHRSLSLAKNSRSDSQ